MVLAAVVVAAALAGGGAVYAHLQPEQGSCVVGVGPDMNVQVQGDQRAVAGQCQDLLASTWNGQPAQRLTAPAGRTACAYRVGGFDATVRDRGNGALLDTLYCSIYSRMPGARRLSGA